MMFHGFTKKYSVIKHFYSGLTVFLQCLTVNPHTYLSSVYDLKNFFLVNYILHTSQKKQ